MAQATHIKAGDIKAVRTSSTSLTYTFTLQLYINDNANIAQDQATLSFGDGSSQTSNKSYHNVVDPTNGTSINLYVFTHTYKAAGFYKAGFQEQNRIANIINMSQSVNTAFYVETAIDIDPFLGLNNSPVLSVPPIDQGAIGEIYTHNPGAYDPDGDSLSYKFVTPQSAAGVNVINFKSPADPAYGGSSTSGGSSTITIDPITGEIVWDTPSDYTNGSLPRYYNIAIMISEWRNGIRIGYVIRDMQIQINDTQNRPPVLKLPADTCVVAGTLLKNTVTASHPNNHNIYMESYSGTYSLATSPANYLPVINNNTSAPSIHYSWQTTCDHIREQPYEIVYRAQDVSTTAPQLTDVRSMLVYVKAPEPKNLVTNPQPTGITLSWDPYKTTVCSSALKIRIYRKECNGANLNPAPCDAGIPATSGYVFIKEIDAGTNTYLDNNNGTGLVPGVIYCYTIIATFAAPSNGVSYPSNESCGQIAVDVPMIASASVTATDPVNGTIQINWFQPLDNVTPPFSYDLYRASSDAPTVYTKINTAALTDTFYTDNNLNTTNKQYFYKTQVNGLELSPIQSSVVFTAQPRNNATFLSWNVSTVCNLDTLEIYRSINGALPYIKIATLLDKVKVGTYLDNVAVHNCDTVNYYVLVKGRYCDPRLKGELYSLSPVRQVIPLDDSPPIAPVLTLKSCAPPFNQTVNSLLWNSVADTRCNTIKGYNIYYSGHNSDGLSLLTFITDTSYVHDPGDSSLAGCYEVKAVNYQNIEGAASNRICIDNCVYYELPNLVTRDNNGLNDIFEAFPIPKGVQVVHFTVFNRWGNQVYSYNGDPSIKWRTVDGASNFLTEGVYYYEAEVHYYRRLNPDDEVQILKGWVHLLGDKEPAKK
ncbi:MAG: hypothetical protein JWO58_740 [Chitinophagaceae bacterium]|nr:hypothetical protein [Chitinophagaceae bacterium]